MPTLSLNASQKTKHTPAGEIPVDWACVKLGDISEITGGIQKGKHRAPKENPVRYLTVAHVHENKLLLDDIRYFEVSPDELERWRILKGDLLIVEGNGSPDQVGRTALFQGEIKDCVHQNHVIRARPNAQLLTPPFANAFINSNAGRKKIMAVSFTSSGLHTLSVGRLRELPIPLPPLPEQKNIAKILSAWDRAIETQQALIAAKTERKNGLMQRFTSHTNNPEWTFMPADGIFENRSERNANNEPILSAAQDRGIVLRSDLKRKIQAEQSNESNYKLVYPGDYVISLRSFQGGLEYSKLKGAVSPAYHIIQPRIKIDRDYYRHYFKSREFIERLSVAVIGIRDGKQIAFRDFSFLKLPYPPIGEQHAIANVLNVAEKEITLLTEQLETLREQKRGLMQSLLTGIVRVKI